MNHVRSGWTRYEQLLLDHSAVGAELARRGRDVRESTPLDTAVSGVITGLVAPLAIGFDDWIHQTSRRHGIRRLYCLARNARVPFDVARARRRDVYDVEIEYLAVSRDLVRMASLASVGPDAWFGAGTATPDSFLRQSLLGQDPHTVVRRLGVDPETDAEVLHQSGWKPDGFDVERFLERARRGPLFDVIDERANEQLALARRYFMTEGLGLGQRIGMVDIGWQGQQAAMIDAVLCSVRHDPPFHLHLGGYRPQTPVQEVSIERWLFDGQPPRWLVSPVPLFETLWPSIGPAAEGLEEAPDGSVKVRFRESPGANHDMDRSIQDLAVRVAAAVDPGLVDAEAHRLGPLVLELARRFWMHPSPDEARAWGRRGFERDGSGRVLAELGAPIAGGDLWAVARRRGSVKRVWPEGAIAASGAPVRLMLSPVRRSRQSLRRGMRTIARRG